MKKAIMFLVILLFVSKNMESYGQETKPKYRYVLWANDNPPKEASLTQVVTWIKAAAKGEKIPGANVRSKPHSYKDVWGETLYNSVINGSENDFTSGYADGSEKNYGVNADGDPETTGILNKGTIVFYFKSIPIVKWGTNGCLNAVSATKKAGPTPDEEDKDNQKPGAGSILTAFNSNPPGITNVITTGGNGNTASPLHYYQAGEMNGVTIYKDGVTTGFNFAVQAQQSTALMAIALQKNASACCGDGGGVTTVTAAQAQPNTFIREIPVTSGTVVTSGTQGTQTTGHTFGQTWVGQTTANAVGGLIANIGTRLLFPNNNNFGGGWFQNGGGFVRGGPVQGGNPFVTTTGGGTGFSSNGNGNGLGFNW